MNEYRRFVQEEITRRNWNASDVEKHGGPTRQVIHTILKDKRPILDQRPKQETVEKLATAFRIPAEDILARVAMAMGLPTVLATADLDKASNEELLEEIRKRMRVGGEGEHDTSPMNQAPGVDRGQPQQQDLDLAARGPLPEADPGQLENL